MNQISKQPRRAVRRSTGAALTLVTISLGLATAMAAALLVESSVRAHASRNAVSALNARYMAESAANVAMFYLVYPREYSGAKPQGYYPGEASMNFASGGTAGSTVTSAGSNTYNLTTNASLSSSLGTFSRTLVSSVEVVAGDADDVDSVHDAVASNAAITIHKSTIVTGSVKSFLGVTIDGGRVTGDVSADAIVVKNIGAVDGIKQSLAEGLIDAEPGASSLIDPTDGYEKVVPDFADLPDMRSYTVSTPFGPIDLNGAKLSSTLLRNQTLGPTLFNPRGVYWLDQSVTIEGDVTINGTLIIRSGGKLKMKGDLTIDSTSAYPALLVEGEIEMWNGADLAAEGLVYAQKIIAGEATLTSGGLDIRGALLLSDGGDLPPHKDKGSTKIVYDGNLAAVPGVGTLRPPSFDSGIRILSWAE